MNNLKIFLAAAVACLVSTSAFADIYEWTDEDGVKHFTNFAPPADARILIKTKEVPYDAEADRARMEEDRQRQLELARLEIAEREAELELHEAEVQRKLEEANRLAKETLQQADSILQEAEYYRRSTDRSWGYWWYGGYYGYRPHYKRWYYGQKKYYPARPELYYSKKHYDYPSRDYRRDYRIESGYRRDIKTNHYSRSGSTGVGIGRDLQGRSHPRSGRISPPRSGLGQRR